MSHAVVAKDHFLENRNVFADADRELEKFNLYTGLANLAGALEELGRQLDQLKTVIKSLDRG